MTTITTPEQRVEPDALAAAGTRPVSRRDALEALGLLLGVLCILLLLVLTVGGSLPLVQ